MPFQSGPAVGQEEQLSGGCSVLFERQGADQRFGVGRLGFVRRRDAMSAWIARRTAGERRRPGSHTTPRRSGGRRGTDRSACPSSSTTPIVARTTRPPLAAAAQLPRGTTRRPCGLARCGPWSVSNSVSRKSSLSSSVAFSPSAIARPTVDFPAPGTPLTTIKNDDIGRATPRGYGSDRRHSRAHRRAHRYGSRAGWARLPWRVSGAWSSAMQGGPSSSPPEGPLR